MEVGHAKQERANRSQYLERRPRQHNPPLFFSSLETSKNRKFHINTKRASVNNQMNDTWPELRCEGCWGLPYCDYISILLPALALLSFFSTSSNFYLLICNYLIFISHPHTTSKSERFNHHLPLPSPRAFCLSRWWWWWWGWWERIWLLTMEGHTRRNSQRQKPNPNTNTHKQTLISKYVWA